MLFLDSGEDQDDVDWRQCNAAARIVAMVPRQIRAGEDYFAAVCPQVYMSPGRLRMDTNVYRIC